MKHNKPNTHHTDIAIIGGGASGLAAAIAAARHGAAVTILEKLPRVGKKILATGNGRCNLGNLSQDAKHCRGFPPPETVLAQFQGEEAFFRSLGLLVRSDEAGRLYPASGQASSVLDALRLECARLGVAEICAFDVREIRPSDGGFLLLSSDGNTARARRVILAAGGCAGPQYGTDGAGFRLAEATGHTVANPFPVLVPIPVEPQRVRALKGLRVQAKVTAYRNGHFMAAEEGQVQFAEGVLSGICVFNLAAYQPDVLSLDLLPWCDEPHVLLTEVMQTRAAALPEDQLTGLFPKRIGQALLKETEITGKPLADLVKDWRFPAKPATNWEAAQATAGGVIHVTKNLESLVVPGLYFAGEVLGVHGDTGGFNLRWAWASGTVAGEQAAKGLER
ncbi:MAG: aminoacetone oxidase family FAD-binding enzyme [Oscillospiraceae bacterium]|nr:aminoacetone oxidase family FAD-binding enzyme [Oscillospiraceae bacterium]